MQFWARSQALSCKYKKFHSQLWFYTVLLITLSLLFYMQLKLFPTLKLFMKLLGKFSSLTIIHPRKEEKSMQYQKSLMKIQLISTLTSRRQGCCLADIGFSLLWKNIFYDSHTLGAGEQWERWRCSQSQGNIKANHNRVICKIPLLHVRCHCSFKGTEWKFPKSWSFHHRCCQKTWQP